MREFEELIGQKVVKVLINKEKTQLVFELEDGRTIVAHAEGDCCSSSWFEHVTGVETLLNQTVVQIVSREMPKQEERGDSCIQFYGWTIVTSRGRCDLEMRNESNGYYGGYVTMNKVSTAPVFAFTEDF